MKNVQWMVMGSYLNYMYAFVCGNCLAKTFFFFTFNRSVSNAHFFFCQIYVCNGTNKRIQHTEFNFLLVSKAIKAVSCITDFGVSTLTITSVVLRFFSTTTSYRLKKKNFPCRNLNHPNLFLV